MSEPAADAGKSGVARWRDVLARYDSAHVNGGRDPSGLDGLDLIAAVLDAARGGDRDEQQRACGLPVSHEVPASHLVLALTQVPRLRDRLDRYERELLEAARDRGESWASLAEQLGRGSEQAMQQRYRRLGGTRSWRGAARITRVNELALLREAVAVAGTAHTSTADWIRAQVALRGALGTVLRGDALSAEEIRATTGCRDYTFVLARDTDTTADLPLDTTTDAGVAKLLAVENFLHQTWWASPPKSGTLAERDRHPATPHPVTAWHELDSRERNRYRAEANRQLTLHPPPPHHPWLHEWRHWFRLLAHETVIAETNPKTGKWLLYELTDTGRPGEHIGEVNEDDLNELASAGLTILDHPPQASTYKSGGAVTEPRTGR